MHDCQPRAPVLLQQVRQLAVAHPVLPCARAAQPVRDVHLRPARRGQIRCQQLWAGWLAGWLLAGWLLAGSSSMRGTPAALQLAGSHH